MPSNTPSNSAATSTANSPTNSSACTSTNGPSITAPAAARRFHCSSSAAPKLDWFRMSLRLTTSARIKIACTAKGAPDLVQMLHSRNQHAHRQMRHYHGYVACWLLRSSGCGVLRSELDSHHDDCRLGLFCHFLRRNLGAPTCHR